MTTLSIQQKINRLPPDLLIEVDKLLDTLLSQCAKTNTISNEEIEAVCGLYQAKHSVSLKQIEQAIIQGALDGNH